MSHDCDESYDVYNERRVKARKHRDCAACKEPIRHGDYYVRVAIVWDGIEVLARCLRCQAIHEHLRKLGKGETWPDERLNCGETYEEHWGQLPEEVARLAFLNADECQALLKETKSDG